MFSKMCSVPNKFHVEVTWTLKSNSQRLRGGGGVSKYSLWTLITLFEKTAVFSRPPKNPTKCLMKLKFRPYSRITFIFCWLKYEEILETLGWLLQKMALKNGTLRRLKILKRRRRRGQEVRKMEPKKCPRPPPLPVTLFKMWLTWDVNKISVIFYFKNWAAFNFTGFLTPDVSQLFMHQSMPSTNILPRADPGGIFLK